MAGEMRPQEAAAFPEPPEPLCCPITRELMRDPVCNSLGNTYERAALVAAWARRPGHECDPLTNVKMPNTALVPNQTVRRQIVAWLDEEPAFVPEGWGGRMLAPLLFSAPAAVPAASESDRDDIVEPIYEDELAEELESDEEEVK